MADDAIPRRDSEEEKLMEKVINQLYAVLDYAEEAENDKHLHRQLEIWADWIIEGICTAIAEGKVKIRGGGWEEVGRHQWPTPGVSLIEDWIRSLYLEKHCREPILIALRKEEP